MRNTGWGVGFLVKHEGFGFDYAKFQVVPWTVWSLEERTSLETPIWKHQPLKSDGSCGCECGHSRRVWDWEESEKNPVRTELWESHLLTSKFMRRNLLKRRSKRKIRQRPRE